EAGVAGMHPAVGRKHFGGALRVFVIAGEHAGRAEHHFTLLGNLDLNIRRGFADSLGMDFAVGLRRDIDRGFGLAVKLFQIKPDAAIEAEDFRSDRLARRVADANAREPELVLQRAIHKKIPERIKQANTERYLLAVENLLAPAVGQRDEVVE